MRLFVGMMLDDDVRERVMATARAAFVDHEGWRLSRPEKLHLTLLFIGDVTEAAVPPIAAAVRACQPATSLALEIGRLDAFPSRRRPAHAYRTVSDPSGRLLTLRNAVVAAIAPCVALTDAKPFVPHITMARARPGRTPTLPVVDMDAVPWSPSQVALFESLPDARGGAYRAIA